MMTRRELLLGTVAAAASAAFAGAPGAFASAAPMGKKIPSSGEDIPCIGLGTWITFNVGKDPVLKNECAEVMRAFFENGGRMVDSSPMYGSSQSTIGFGLNRLSAEAKVFSADKVWTSEGNGGLTQIETSRSNWQVPRFNLLQVHNLLAWEPHLDTLFAMKSEGQLDYVGITTSHGRRHGELEKIMATHPLDFVQFTYNVLDREAESRLLPLAKERGIAVIANRPFQRGRLTSALERHPLPSWAKEDASAATWAQLILKFIVSHPAVTCAIPATSRVDHVRENLAAGQGPMLDDTMRKRVIAHIQSL